MADLGNIGRLVEDILTLHGGVISGQVLDASSQPCARIVRANHRKTGFPSGSAISKPSDGSYTLYTNILFGKEPHTVIEFDDAAGDSYNARVFDNVIPL